jgi:hypothetical protein
MPDPSLPIRFDLQVPSDGRVEVQLPLLAGAQVTMYVVQQLESEFDELAAASTTSTEFWDNPDDDEDWNNA